MLHSEGIRRKPVVTQRIRGDSTVHQLHSAVQTIDRLIEAEGLDAHKTRGLIGMEAGFFLTIITPTTEDDPEKLERLRRAAEVILGEKMPF